MQSLSPSSSLPPPPPLPPQQQQSQSPLGNNTNKSSLIIPSSDISHAGGGSGSSGTGGGEYQAQYKIKELNNEIERLSRLYDYEISKKTNYEEKLIQLKQIAVREANRVGSTQIRIS